MTEDEIDKYINQIAFSGAEEFLQQYKGQEGAEQIIGHFGLGFYSAFMVAEKVQIRTLSRHEGAKAVQWESNGSPDYTIFEKDLCLDCCKRFIRFLLVQNIPLSLIDKSKIKKYFIP